jgi:RNA methyltransferase, TrmH family
MASAGLLRPLPGLTLHATMGPDHPLIRQLARLDDARERREQGLFLAEGRRIIDGFLQAGGQPVHLLVREGEALPPSWPAATTISAKAAQRLTSLSTASGYVAAFALPTAAAVRPERGGLVLADIADPGNAGTLIRSAAAFGYAQVIVSGGVDPWSPKVVQASAGALAQVAIHRGIEPQELAGATCCALVVSGGSAPTALPRQPRWLVVGGEAHGVPPAWLAVCREQLTLPMPGGTESLNAAVAGSIAAYVLAQPPAAA